MTIVALTADPNLSMALSLRNDLGTVKIVSDQRADPTTADADADAVAVIIDLTDGSSPDVVRRWREVRPGLPIILVGGAETSYDLPLIHRLSRPFSLEGLAAMLRDLTHGELDDEGGDEPWLRRWLQPFRHRGSDGAAEQTGGNGGTGGEGDADPGTYGDPASPLTSAASETPDATEPHVPATAEAETAPTESEAAQRLELRPLRSTRGQVRPREAEDVRPTDATAASNDLPRLAHVTVERIEKELAPDTVIVWGRDDRCMYVVAATGLSETERCLTLPLEHPILRALEGSSSVSLPAGDLFHAINGLPRLMSRPAHAVAVCRDGDLHAVVMVADPSLFDEDQEIVQRAVSDIWS